MTLAKQVQQVCRDGRSELAIALLEQRLAEHDGEAALIYGQWHVEGKHLPRDFARAFAFFNKAVEWGCNAATVPLIAMLARGPGNCQRNWAEAKRHLMADARSNPQAARQITLLSAMELDDSGDPTQTYQPVFLSHDPLVVRFPAFLSADECAMLIEMAQPKLRPATVIHPVTGQLVTDPVRTSFAAAFPLLEETPFLHAVNRRIAAASRSHVEQGEPAQILSYSSGQQYHLHSDAIHGEANQRIQTFLIYLNDDFQGGETFFPYGKLSLRPARGDAICFSNVDTAMRPAATAQHAGLPVTTGRKYLLSRWIRRNPLNLGGPLTN